MNRFEFISEFNIKSGSLDQLKRFVELDTTSPYLTEVRKKVSKPKVDTSKPSGSGADAFSQFESKEDTSKLDLHTLNEEQLNETLEEMTDEDFQDMGEIAIELLDFAMDKVFIMLSRKPSENDKLADVKKERLKILAGRLLKKWGVKFSLEVLGLFVLLSYINMRWSKAEKIESEEGETKVIKMPKRKTTNAEKKIDKTSQKKNKAKAITRPATKSGLINIHDGKAV